VEKKIKIIIWILIAVIIFQAVLFAFFQKEEIAKLWPGRKEAKKEIPVSQIEEISAKVEAFKERCLKNPQPLMEAWAIDTRTIPEANIGENEELKIKELSRNYIYCLAIENKNEQECGRFLEKGAVEVRTQEGKTELIKEGLDNYNTCRMKYFILNDIIFPILRKELVPKEICQKIDVMKTNALDKKTCEIFWRAATEKNPDSCKNIADTNLAAICGSLISGNLGLCGQLKEDWKNRCLVINYYFKALKDNDKNLVQKFIEGTQTVPPSETLKLRIDDPQFLETARALFYDGKTCFQIYHNLLQEKYCEMEARRYEYAIKGLIEE